MLTLAIRLKGVSQENAMLKNRSKVGITCIIAQRPNRTAPAKAFLRICRYRPLRMDCSMVAPLWLWGCVSSVVFQNGFATL
jgi:hypothetical protein